jgi:hypothetical protein
VPRKVRTKVERKHAALVHRAREDALSELESVLHGEWAARRIRYSPARPVPLAVVELCPRS